MKRPARRRPKNAKTREMQRRSLSRTLLLAMLGGNFRCKQVCHLPNPPLDTRTKKQQAMQHNKPQPSTTMHQLGNSATRTSRHSMHLLWHQIGLLHSIITLIWILSTVRQCVLMPKMRTSTSSMIIILKVVWILSGCSILTSAHLQHNTIDGESHRRIHVGSRKLSNSVSIINKKSYDGRRLETAEPTEEYTEAPTTDETEKPTFLQFDQGFWPTESREDLTPTLAPTEAEDIDTEAPTELEETLAPTLTPTEAEDIETEAPREVEETLAPTEKLTKKPIETDAPTILVATGDPTAALDTEEPTDYPTGTSDEEIWPDQETSSPTAPLTIITDVPTISTITDTDAPKELEETLMPTVAPTFDTDSPTQFEDSFSPTLAQLFDTDAPKEFEETLQPTLAPTEKLTKKPIETDAPTILVATGDPTAALDTEEPTDYPTGTTDEEIWADQETSSPTASPTIFTDVPTISLSTGNGECTPCTDEPSPFMRISRSGGNDYRCDSWPYVWEDNCVNGSEDWLRNRFCSLTCYERGVGYPGDDCCPREITEKPTPKPSSKPATHRPSSKPTKKPTSSQKPTERPTQFPTQYPTFDDIDEDNSQLEYVGQCTWRPCGRCSGDCDANHECEGNLICYQRTGNWDPVPGCSGVTYSDVDYCISPDDLFPSSPTDVPTVIWEDPTDAPTVVWKDTPKPTHRPVVKDNEGTIELVVVVPAGVDVKPSTLSKCQGDCRKSDDCMDGLECYKRTDGRLKFVPGCEGQGEKKTDYCYDPLDMVPTSTEKPKELSSSTSKPTRKPSPRPTMPTGSSTLTVLGKDLDWLLGRCEGDCDSDRDCSSGLRCYKRTDGRLKTVPGCSGTGRAGVDYCYDFTMTQAPTRRPTRPPTVPDAIFITAPPTKGPSRAPVSYPTFSPTTTPSKVPTSLPTRGKTFTGESADIGTPAPSPEMNIPILEDEEIWVNLSPFTLDLTLPLEAGENRFRDLVARKADDEDKHHSQNNRLLVEKTELQRIVGTIIDGEFREYSPSFRGLLIGAKLRNELDLENARVLSYEFSGSALFNRDDRHPAPGTDVVETIVAESLLEQDELLNEFRRSKDPDVRSASALYLAWADGRDFEVRGTPASAIKGDNAVNQKNVGAAIAAGITAFVCTAILGAAMILWWKKGKRPFASHQDTSQSASLALEEGEENKTPYHPKTNQVGIARAFPVSIPSPDKTVASLEMSTPAKSADEECGHCLYHFGDISEIDDSLRSGDLGDIGDIGESNSDWSVDDVANTAQEAIPIPTAYMSDVGTIDTTTLGDVHASSILNLDDATSASGTSSNARPRFNELWRQKQKKSIVTGRANDDEALGMSLAQNRGMAISADSLSYDDGSSVFDGIGVDETGHSY